MNGFSIATNVNASFAQFNLNLRQSALQSDVSKLSSGLRIQSAVDDPSGFAISQNLQAQVAGYQAAIGNVQTAKNATFVAEQSLSTITNILQRIRSLAIEAANDISSGLDRADIQAEVNQLQAEIVTIVRDTSFNGKQLLDGSNALNLAYNGAPILPGAASPGPALNNASFESPNVGSGTFNAFQYDPTGAGWTFSTYSGITGINSGFSSGAPPPPNGVQEGFIQSYSGSNGSITQDVTLQANTVYTVTFAATQRRNYENGGEVILVQLDGQNIGRVFASSGTYSFYSSAPIVTSAGVHTLSFVGVDPNGLDNTAFIDNVKIVGQAVPYAGPAVPDGSFEQVPIDAGYTFGAFQYDPTGSPWFFTGNAGVSSNGSGFTAGNPIAPDGGQVGLVQFTGSMQEDISGFQAGVTYELGLLAANRVSSPGGQTQTISVSIDGRAIATITPTTANYQQFYSSSFAPGAGTHVLKITGLDPYGNDETAFIDHLQIFGSNAPTTPETSLTVQDGASEGNQILLTLPDARPVTLGASSIDVSTFASAETAIGQMDGALGILMQARAQLGAQVVSLGENARNGALAVLNETSALSSIRDLNIGQAVGNFTRDSVLQSVATSVLAQANNDPRFVLALFKP